MELERDPARPPKGRLSDHLWIAAIVACAVLSIGLLILAFGEPWTGR
jgi:hypothetical protein